MNTNNALKSDFIYVTFFVHCSTDFKETLLQTVGQTACSMVCEISGGALFLWKILTTGLIQPQAWEVPRPSNRR